MCKKGPNLSNSNRTIQFGLQRPDVFLGIFHLGIAFSLRVCHTGDISI